MTLVMAFGTFDIFHKGHEFYLKEAKKLGTQLVVVVSRDCNIIKLKGEKPLHSEDARLKEVISKDYVDEAVLGFPDDLFRIIIDERPNVICLGYDQWAKEKDVKAALNKRGFTKFKIVRVKSYKPETYKSSLIKKEKKN